MELIPWNGNKSKDIIENERQPVIRCFACLTIADQLFAVFDFNVVYIDTLDVCVRF